jgi:uncharacterized protein (TIGR02145 family)
MRKLVHLLIVLSIIGCGAKQNKVAEVHGRSDNSVAVSQPEVYDFKTVLIGENEWTSENISINEFADGSLIPQATTKEEWQTAIDTRKPAWCYYEFSEENGTQYGKLYNRYAIFSTNGFAPKGWVLPINEDWEAIKIALGDNAAYKMKSPEVWEETVCNNDSGFSALPGGKIEVYVSSQGEDSVSFSGIGEVACFWSASNGNPLQYFVEREVSGFEGKNSISRVISSSGSGYYVRLIKGK